jgi:hypothetical protein
MKKLAPILGLFILLIIAAALLLPTLTWIGAANVQIELQLTDQRNSRPVSGARIWILDSRHAIFASTNTFPGMVSNEQGRAVTTILCGAGGAKSLFRKRGHYGVSQEVLIEAPGYHRICTPLANLLGNNRWPIQKKRHSLTLWLMRDEPQPTL